MTAYAYINLERDACHMQDVSKPISPIEPRPAISIQCKILHFGLLNACASVFLVMVSKCKDLWWTAGNSQNIIIQADQSRLTE